MSTSSSSDQYDECVDSEFITNGCDSTDQDHGSCFVAVHIGAGFHSQAKTPIYKLLCEKTCSKVIKMLNKGCNARDAAAYAVALLEVNKNF